MFNLPITILLILASLTVFFDTVLSQPSKRHLAGIVRFINPTQPLTHSPHKVKSYHSLQFEAIRNAFGISNYDWKNSFPGDLKLYGRHGSSGKSGSVFFTAPSGKFLIKSLKYSEGLKLSRSISQFQEFMVKNANQTLISPYLALFKVQTNWWSFSSWFCISVNVLPGRYILGNQEMQLYDLKGSTNGRIVDQSSKGAHRDLNWINKREKLRFVTESDKKTFLDKIERDSLFLRDLDLYDYSLLIGKENRDISNVTSDLYDVRGIDQYPSGTLYIGIIDCLTEFDMWKGVFLWFRGFVVDKNTISLAEPTVYQRRFKTFISNQVTVGNETVAEQEKFSGGVSFYLSFHSNGGTAFSSSIPKMSRHSKNNSARSYFSSQEKGMLKNEYGTIQQRLGKDSMRSFDSCFLCLQRARNPVCCPQGHLACKECLYENILAQKSSIQRELEFYNVRKAHEEEAKKLESQIQETRKVDSFIKSQKLEFESAAPLKSRVIEGVVYKIKETKGGQILIPDQIETEKLNNGAIDRPIILQQSFWIVSIKLTKPSNTPDAKPVEIKEPSQQTVCSATDVPHAVSIKKLTALKFTESGSDWICVSCTKTLHNGIKIGALKNCGHVFCSSCIKQFVEKQKKCVVCDEKCKTKDLIQLANDGTGFSGSGDAQKIAKVYTHAMQ